jgi:hypothetical protein
MRTTHAGFAHNALLGLAATLLTWGTVGAQTTAAPPDTLLIKGIVADANGPLARKVLIVMPIDPTEDRPVTLQAGAHSTLRMDGYKKPKEDKWTYSYTIVGDPQLGPRLNPKTTTDAKGSFSVRVPRDLFKRFKPGVLSLGVFDGLVSSYEPEIIKYDDKAATIDVGQLVFRPVRNPTE